MKRNIHKPQTNPEDEGYEAYFLEGAVAINPYRIDTIDWCDWNNGFKIAEDDDYDDD